MDDYRDMDPADTPWASVEPEEIRDSASDILKDQACQYRGKLPQSMPELRQVFFQLIDDGMKEFSQSGEREDEKAVTEAIVRLLQIFRDAPNGRLLAHVYLLLINRNPYSESEIAQMLGVTKAAVSKVKVALQDYLDLSSRVGKSKEARQKYRELCLDRGKRKPQDFSWPANGSWKPKQ